MLEISKKFKGKEMTEFRCQVCNGDIPTEYDVYFIARMILCKYCAEYYLTVGLEE